MTWNSYIHTQRTNWVTWFRIRTTHHSNNLTCLLHHRPINNNIRRVLFPLKYSTRIWISRQIHNLYSRFLNMGEFYRINCLIRRWPRVTRAIRIRASCIMRCRTTMTIEIGPIRDTVSSRVGSFLGSKMLPGRWILFTFKSYKNENNKKKRSTYTIWKINRN